MERRLSSEGSTGVVVLSKIANVSATSLLLPLLIVGLVVIALVSMIVLFAKSRGSSRNQDRQPAEDEFEEELRRAREDDETGS